MFSKSTLLDMDIYIYMYTEERECGYLERKNSINYLLFIGIFIYFFSLFFSG